MHLLLLNWPHMVLGPNSGAEYTLDRSPSQSTQHLHSLLYLHFRFPDHAKVHICLRWRLIHPWRKPMLGSLHTKNPRAWAQTWDSQEVRKKGGGFENYLGEGKEKQHWIDWDSGSSIQEQCMRSLRKRVITKILSRTLRPKESGGKRTDDLLP